jgi:hypothetical protein
MRLTRSWRRAPEMDVLSRGGLGFFRLVVMVGVWVLGPGDRCDGNDDCHSEIRGVGTAGQCPVVSCLDLTSRVGIA